MIDPAVIRYKIKHKTTGLFSNGGMYDSWSKHGKIWNSLGALRSYLTAHIRCSSTNDFSNWEIVEFVLTVNDIKQVHEVLTAKRLLEMLKK